MNRRQALGMLAAAGLGQAPSLGDELRAARPEECVPALEDYSLLWWANGWGVNAPADPKVLCVLTGFYGLALNVETLELLHFGGIGSAAGYSDAEASGPGTLETLPAGQLAIRVRAGGTVYRSVRAARRQSDSFEFPIRIVETGRYLHRVEIHQLEFASESGETFNATGRLEIIAWPDRAALRVAITAAEDGDGADVEIDLNGQVSRSPETSTWKAGETRGAWVASEFRPHAAAQVRSRAKVDWDAARGWHRIELPGESWNLAAEPDHLERLSFTVANSGDRPASARLLFAKDYSFPGITGMTPMLRDAQGQPCGLFVQLSKNWHQKQGRPLDHQGPWFHGFAVLRVPPQCSVTFEFCLAYARWGGVPAASHAQLSLIGWGGRNQLWHQAAIGSWGESICYDPDTVQRRCQITDVRPLMVWAMKSAEPKKWDWTNNVGGGDFLVYLDAEGRYRRLSQVRSGYHRHGPNLTGISYTSVTADGAIAARIEVALPRTDDLVRCYHRFRYQVLKTARFSRLAFYQLGADDYLWHQFNQIARGNESGLLEEWRPNRGGRTYDRKGIPLPGRVPWLSLHDASRQFQNRAIQGGWATRGLVIRRWSAMLGGEPAAPHASVFRTDSAGVASTNVELSPPPGIEVLRAGDFVEAEVELLIVPMLAGDYYGPNSNLRVSLERDANTWKPVLRQAVGNDLELSLKRGSLTRQYPPAIRVDGEQSAEVELRGGLAYLPVTFSGLRGYKGFRLLLSTGDAFTVVDQSVHGNDFWQADYDPRDATWALTYNLPLDTPADERRPITLRFEEQAR